MDDPATVSGTYAWLVRRVWRGLEGRTGYPPVMLPGVGRLGSYCPISGCSGTILVEFLDGPPRVRFSGLTWEGGQLHDQCSHGCTADEIVEALTS